MGVGVWLCWGCWECGWKGCAVGLSGLVFVVVVFGGVWLDRLKAFCSWWRAVVTRGEGGWNGDGISW